MSGDDLYDSLPHYGDCDDGTKLELVENGVWLDTAYADEYRCTECGAEAYEVFTSEGWNPLEDPR